jgi:hypothetical protein
MGPPLAVQLSPAPEIDPPPIACAVS